MCGEGDSRPEEQEPVGCVRPQEAALLALSVVVKERSRQIHSSWHDPILDFLGF